MAGSNKIVKKNEILFKIGDPADAMYLVRQGNFKVYFMKGAEEVVLATLQAGAIVGEMAFFDDKPRSASVRATSVSEVTVITKADFERLLKQIPGWFVAMMKSLSGRLRQTNERLAALEAERNAGSGATTKGILPGQIYPFQFVNRSFQVIMLSFARDGIKDNPKELTLDSDLPRDVWVEFFGESERGLFDRILQEVAKIGFVSLKPVPQKGPTIQFLNRGGFAHFIQFFSEIAKKLSADSPSFSVDAIAFFEALLDAVAVSGYPQFAVNIADLIKSTGAKGVQNSGWVATIPQLQLLPDVKFTGSGNDITVRISLKEHKLILQYLKIIQHFGKAGLA